MKTKENEHIFEDEVTTKDRHENLPDDPQCDMEKMAEEICRQYTEGEEEHPGDGISKFIKGSRFYEVVVDIDIDTIPEENEETEDQDGEEDICVDNNDGDVTKDEFGVEQIEPKENMNDVEDDELQDKVVVKVLMV